MDIFLLTKPPQSSRAKLCFKLLERSEDVHLYLAGDGVYCLLEELDLLPAGSTFACREDLAARGIYEEDTTATIPECFYSHLVKALMRDKVRVYTF